MLDGNLESVEAPPVPFINEANAFDFVDLLNAEPTPGPSSDVDAFDADDSDIHFGFPRLYLPTDGVTAGPQGALDMLDAGASGDISGLCFEPENVSTSYSSV